MKGIQEEYSPPPPVVGNVFEMSAQRRQALNIKTLPSSLGEAITLAEHSELLPEVLGDHIYTSLLRNKELEWSEYRSVITDYEISRYLPTL